MQWQANGQSGPVISHFVPPIATASVALVHQPMSFAKGRASSISRNAGEDACAGSAVDMANEAMVSH